MNNLQHNLRVEPYEYQKEGICYGLDHKRILIGDAPGLGKCQSLDSKVYTPDGMRLMGELRVGGQIFGADGKIYQIENIYPQGVKPMYRVIFSDGSSTKCTMDHLWNVRDENRKRRGTGWVTKTLEELMVSGIKLKQSINRTLSGRKEVNKWEIPMCSPVKYPIKDYIIPAYTMGAFLGDGAFGNTHISFSISKEKRHIINKIKESLHETLYIRESNYNEVYRHSLYTKERRNIYAQGIRDLGLNLKSKDKFIPDCYKYGSIEQRIDLLHGLMDTDGSCNRNRTTFHTTSIRLALDIREIVQSLGGIAIIRQYDRSHEEKPTEYQVNIRTNFCPFSAASYKSQNWRPHKVFKVARYIDDVEYIGEEECQCIKVSAPDELYLTDEYIVTHNTIQSIGIVDTANAYPCLVICPSSLKINWQREFTKFTNKSAIVLDNNVRTTWGYLLSMGVHQVAVVNYESLRKYFVWDIKGDGKSFRLKDVVFNPQINVFKSIIIDESHRVKDPSAQQTIFTKGLSTGKEWCILLSGTPVVNRPEDLIAQLSIMGRLNEFGGRAKFVADYCTDPKDKKAEPAVPLSELSKQLYSTCMIRREKSKVLPQLPDKTRVDLYVEISNNNEYNLASEDLAQYLREYTECTDRDIRRKMRMEALVKFMTLRALATKGKVAQAIDFIRTFLANGKKLIVFCSLHEIVDELLKAFPDAVTVTGRDSAADKQSAVDQFQTNPDVNLIICSIKAAGVGLTLTASSDVVFVELAWTFADCAQCEDRAHRIGQKDNVTCYYLLGRGTIDSTIYNLIHRKKSIANEIMNSEDDIPTDEMYFDELVNSFLNTENKF